MSLLMLLLYVLKVRAEIKHSVVLALLKPQMKTKHMSCSLH